MNSFSIGNPGMESGEKLRSEVQTVASLVKKREESLSCLLYINPTETQTHTRRASFRIFFLFSIIIQKISHTVAN